MIKTIEVLALIVSLSAAVCFGILACRELQTRREGKDYYAQLSQMMKIGAQTDVRIPAPEKKEPESATGQQGTDAALPQQTRGSAADGFSEPDAGSGELTTGAAKEETITAAEGRKDHETEPDFQSVIDFDRLRQTCRDAVGWINMEDTDVSYPIVQGTDNSFYMDHLPNREWNSAGSIMMDVRNAPDFSDTITVLHGHHMRNGSMFGSLDDLTKAEYFRDNPYFDIYTPEKDYKVKVIAILTMEAMKDGYPIRFENDAQLSKFLADAKRKAVYSAEIEIAPGSRFVLLSTCAYSFKNARLVILGQIQ